MIPTEETVTAEWLSEQLNRNGVNGQVTSFTAQRIGTGQIGKCLRYELSYAPGTSGPTSLVGKFPSDDPTSRATGVALKNFIREVRFYQELQSLLSIRTPRCYFAEIIDEGPEFMLLLEDMAPAEQGNQLAGCDAPTAEAAVLQLVGLHAPSWNATHLRDKAWLAGDPEPDPALPTTRDLYRMQLPGFMDYFGDKLADDERHIIEQVGAAEEGPLFHRDPAPFSLVHVDYRLDNLLFNPNGEVTAVDWQSITLGAPLNDVAYFMGAGLLPEARLGVERDIVQKYHQ
ncbi:MAG: phosphotransferase, partial [Pseudomonadota bacterium]